MVCILALDTSSAACNVALLTDHQLSSDEVIIGIGHAEYLIPQINSLMAKAEVGFEALDKIVVTIGPGSFMGVKVGLSVARAFALSLSIPLIGISNLEALAGDAMQFGNTGPVLVAIDARNSELYIQAFELRDEVIIPITDAKTCSVEEAAEMAVGLQAKLIGSGASYIAQVFPDTIVVGTNLAPSITRIASSSLSLMPGTIPGPLYLRPAS